MDTGNCYYMLNPSGNLGNTEKMFSKWFNRLVVWINQRNVYNRIMYSEPGWSGVVGKVTNHDHMETITKHEMFM